ncbi:Beta-hexosaminidase [Fusarium sp. Ph1]|nr:Beta-hexosaminidase [Fusarium sp. Ph1]
MLFGDFFPYIAPYIAYFHTGGDELKENDSNLNPDIRSNDTKVLSPLLQKFVSYTDKKNLTIGSDVLVQSWLRGSAVKDLAEGGRKVIDSNYEFWYLDCGRGQWLNFANGDTFKKYYPFNDWCGPTKSWQLVYAHDPLAGISKNAVQNVLGGEVAVWTETIDAVNLDTLLSV